MSHVEHEGEHEESPTEASNGFLGNTFNRLVKEARYAGITIATEFMTYIGGPVLAVGLMCASPALTVVGAATAGIGMAIGWEGVRHGSWNEKVTFGLIKVARTVSQLYAPLLTGALNIASAASTWLGARKLK